MDLNMPCRYIRHCKNAKMHYFPSLQLISATPESLALITLTSSWVRWRFKAPALRLFTQPFIQAQVKEKNQSSVSPMNSPHKGPVTRKVFPFDDVIMTKGFHFDRVSRQLIKCLFLLSVVSAITQIHRHNVQEEFEANWLGLTVPFHPNYQKHCRNNDGRMNK